MHSECSPHRFQASRCQTTLELQSPAADCDYCSRPDLSAGTEDLFPPGAMTVVSGDQTVFLQHFYLEQKHLTDNSWQTIKQSVCMHACLPLPKAFRSLFGERLSSSDSCRALSLSPDSWPPLSWEGLLRCCASDHWAPSLAKPGLHLHGRQDIGFSKLTVSQVVL